MGLLALVSFQACKEEPLNAECDIERVTIHCSDPGSVFFNLTDTARDVLYTDNDIVFHVRGTADLSTVTPEFKITPGATIEPLGAGARFKLGVPVKYRVTSQDGQWHRLYSLCFAPITHTVSDTTCYDFEHYELDPKTQKYYVWSSVQDDGTQARIWATGNGGFLLSKGSALPLEYPTAPEPSGYDGACVRLTTRSTGAFGVMSGKRLAAGNFFMGEFDVATALKNPLLATKFGLPFSQKPVKITGYYKYKPGSKYCDKNGQEILNRVDSASVYAVFYLNHDAQGNALVLHGDDVTTSPQIVGRARFSPIPPTDTWTYFEMTFAYAAEIDKALLENLGYSLTIVFSSSAGGAYFEGAVDSELMIDRVRLICTKEE